jgi:aminoglycoside phosphotransferase family enzyme/predicted kinase
MVKADDGPMMEGAQEPTLTFLQNPHTHGGATVSRIDTHAACVFLAGARAYKVKRAVRFPFLDYSTLANRKAACEAELDVNRRFAPQLYRRVIAVTQESDGQLALEGHGRPVEWAVEMVRFDEKQTLDHVAERGELGDGLARRLGAVVAAAHAAAERAGAEAWIDAVSAYIEQTERALRERPDLFIPSEVDALSQASRSAYAAGRALMMERGVAGLIRRGHGDLHLRNIVLIDTEPVLFDAIEFNPLVASGDVLYDLAFLLMDLIHRNCLRAANEVLNAYLAATRRPEDLDGLRLLPLFLSLRSAIRAMVTAMRVSPAMSERAGGLVEEARSYFALARHLVASKSPQLVAVGGLSGTGKSTLARSLAPELPPFPGAIVLRSDVERKALFGIAETAPLPAKCYAPDVTAQVYEVLRDKARRVLSAGHSAVVDAVFARPQERLLFDDLACERSVRFAGLFLTADLSTRIRRAEERGLDASDAGRSVVEMQESYNLGEVKWISVDASGAPEEALQRARSAMGLRNIP